ncbi:MAG: hypothetical protein DRP58_02520 [Spirochaetes bacterium]|nr:MAG: hypothetical protein DRP58_02520 [Spirochaetota bacterium]
MFTKKIFWFLIFTLVILSIILAEPTQANINIVEKYKNFELDLSNKEPDRVWTTQKLYSFNGYKAWVFDSGYAVVRFDDNLELKIYPNPKKTKFLFQDGRSCTYYPEKKLVDWSLVMESAPDFTLPIITNPEKFVKLSDLKGSVVVVDFWASWCSPCKKYLPKTQELHEEYKDQGLVVLGVNIEGNDSRAMAVIKDLNLTFDILKGEPGADGSYNWSSSQIQDFKIGGIPSVFLIDKKGVIRYNSTVLRDNKLIETLLAE